jgi:Carboxypeptidase regulatory-like domain
VSIERATTCHYCPRWVSALWLIFGFVALLLSSGCHSGAARVDAGPKPAVIQGTITGTIRGTEGTSPVSGRTVEIVNITTGERHSATTSSNGGFSSHLPPGRYRIELPLRTGETLVARPEVVSLDKGGTDPHVEIVLGATRVVRPRGPAYRVDNGLGSPSA